MPSTSHPSGHRWPRRANIFGLLEIVSLVVLLTMAVVSWLALGRPSPEGELIPSRQAAVLLIGTLIPAMASLVLFGRRLALKRAGGNTARLHVRLVFFFSLVAAIPTLLVAIFASFLFQTGAEFWFSDTNRGILTNANELARGYYDQNQRTLVNNTIAMAGDLRYYLEQKSVGSADFTSVYYLQAYQRELNQSAIIQIGADGILRTPAIVNPEDGEHAKRGLLNALPKLNAGADTVVTASRDWKKVCRWPKSNQPSARAGRTSWPER